MSDPEADTTSDGVVPEADRKTTAVVNTEIAIDMLEYLRENPQVCAWLSIHVGNHPYVRWDGDQYLVAENVGYGEIEVQQVSGESLTETFAENPIDLIPLQEATDNSGNELWKRVKENDDKVSVLK